MNIYQQNKKKYSIGRLKWTCAGMFLYFFAFVQSVYSQNETGQQVKNLGKGFLDHGVAVPIASSRGTVATVDGEGRNVILTWLYDRRGTYSLLLIDTEGEKSKQFYLPSSGDSYTSLLSSQNRYYTHFDGQFVEFDPAERGFTFIGKTPAGTAMSMTEDIEGTIWAALSPNSRLISYDPNTKKLKDYGVMYSNKARQIPRSITTDGTGWVYLVAGPPGNKKVVAFNPETRSKKLLEIQNKSSRRKISSLKDGGGGLVYGRVKGRKEWVELQDGAVNNIATVNKTIEKSYVTGNQALFARTFPDNKRISDWVSAVTPGFLKARSVTIDDPRTGKSKTVKFDYETEGANIMGLASTVDGKIIGGSNFPMLFFELDPKIGERNIRYAYGQFNTLARDGDTFYIGGYPRGFLLEWNTKEEWIQTQKNKKTNPFLLIEATPYIFRPHDLLMVEESNEVIMAGRPPSGKTGGGLLFWDREKNKADLLKHTEVRPNQSTQSLVSLGNDLILGGTTIKPGDAGGVRKAKEAELYIMNLENRKIMWVDAVIAGARNYQDLCATPNGLVLGVAENNHFFIFDPETQKILNQVDLEKEFGSRIPYTQGQRIFILGPENEVYLLLRTGILQINIDNFEITLLAKPPKEIKGGGAYFDGRLYYISGKRSRIHSYKLMAPK